MPKFKNIKKDKVCKLPEFQEKSWSFHVSCLDKKTLYFLTPVSITYMEHENRNTKAGQKTTEHESNLSPLLSNIAH